MRTIRLLTAILLITPLASCTGANRYGSHERSNVQTLIQKWDLNQDGNITCGEWDTYCSGLFQQADDGRDGFLAAQEFYSLTPQDRIFTKVTLSNFDQNSDSKVSLEEFKSWPNPIFVRFDNKSLTLSGLVAMVLWPTPNLRHAASA
jgi:hypothetical protein